VRLRAPADGTDRRGNPQVDWTAAARLEITGCAVAPRPQGENRAEGRQAVTRGWTVYAPGEPDVAATDRLEVRGETFDVDGDPAVWLRHFSGGVRGVVIDVRSVEG